MKRYFLLALLVPALTAWGGETDVLDVEVNRTENRTFRFDVTLRHDDAGWEHYADKWEVLSPDGAVLATRVLYHPHVDEQPFTRSLGNVNIPGGISQVKVRGHDSVHGYGGKVMTVALP